MRPFDVRDPLPSGVTVLEASAGTGKTWAITALAARYVAEGMPLERLLLVTFTRAATSELRERVRERLVAVERALERALASAPASDDPVVELLCDGPVGEVRRRRDRLARAVADFDAATIATTHGFCQEVLGELGIAADLEPDASFVEDLGDLESQVVDDLYIRAFHQRGEPPFSRREAAQIARAAVGNPGARIVAAPGGVAERRRRLALAVLEELERRKRGLSVMTYDDLLTRLADALRGDGGEAVAARLRARYAAVLVDEFQDTDPVQWEIMRRAFGDGGVTLVLVADPKQAIYAFRGADVYAYLEASRQAAARATLAVNWRSDQALLDAYDALFANSKLGHEGIVYRSVRAADANRAPRISGAPVSAALRIRVVERDSVHRTPRGFAGNVAAREHIAKDLAGDVVALLSSRAQIESRSLAGVPTGRTRVRPAHVAVLVQTHRGASLVRDALDDAGVPVVINGAGSVFRTESAREWLRLLEALEHPASTQRAHAAALTPFLGWSPDRVAAADEETWEEVHRRLHEWGRVLRVRGVASLAETISAAEQLPRRILGLIGGERRLTDLRHIGQLLHAEASTLQVGTTALTAWLRGQIAETSSDTGDEERSRRLESDAEAVQVLTIHRSKGLEFPIVYLPFLWEPGWIPSGAQPVFFHDPDAGDERALDVSLEGEAYERHHRQHRIERRGEDLRLAYVALTRACHQAVIWWAGSWDSRHSALGRLLFARDADGDIAPEGAFTPADDAAFQRFEDLAAAAPGRMSVERSTLGLPAAWSDPIPDTGELSAARFDRGIDRNWRRTSYSDITAAAHDARVTSEEEEPVIGDEPEDEAGLGAPEPAPDGDAPPSLLAQMPAGLRIGTFVHRVLAAADFDAPDLDAELSARISEMQGWRALDIGDPASVVAGLRAAIETPLGPLLGGARLRDVGAGDRLDELEFELPIAGGEEPDGRVTPGLIGSVLRERLAAGDPLAGYADWLDDPALRGSVRGYLTGSLDLVARVAGADGPRFAVLDYKTNWLAVPGEPLTTWHHRPTALTAEMYRRHYGLQALLYVVALHRYLRWRLPGYEPGRHLAGVLYLFVRGMVGPDTPVVDGTPCGVFAWRPPAGVVEAISDALDQGVV
jgi:exodeoxyribonuclease V beta subunit